MIWIILTLTARISTSCSSSVIQKILIQRRWSSPMILAVSLSIVAGSLVAWAIVTSQFTRLPQQSFWMGIAIASVLDVAGNLLLVRAIGHGDMSVIGPLNSYKPLVGVALGVLMLGELPTFWGYAGIIVIVAGSLLLLQPKTNKSWMRNSRPTKPVCDRLMSILFTASASIFLKNAIQSSNPAQAYVGWSVGCCLLAWISVAITYQKSSSATQAISSNQIANDWILLASSGLSFLVMQGATIWLFAQMHVGYALALFQLASIIQVFLGRKLFREDKFLRRLIASLVMTIGATMVLLGG
jgi:drug/metabolite transporter (DMT)-like permease